MAFLSVAVAPRCYTGLINDRTHQYEVACACGNRWRFQADVEPDAVECIGCGADAFEIVDLGQVRPSY